MQEKLSSTTYTQKVKDKSFEAIQKELKLENLLENEIKEREKHIVDMKAKEFEKEKYKLDCLNKAIKEKEIDEEYNIAIKNKESRIDNLKKQVANTINVKRARLKSKLEKIKKISHDQVENYDSKIMNIRLEMLNTFNNQRNYNPLKCKNLNESSLGNEFEVQRKTYCDNAISDDIQEYQKCIISEKNELVLLCCDLETNPEIPENYKKCLNEINTNKSPSDLETVRYFWGKPYERILSSK